MACPIAQLVCNWAMVERHSNCFDFPLERCRWIMHDESFSIGARTLHAVRPPVCHSPTTRGLFDPTTGVYWPVDTFATPLSDPHIVIADLDPDFWQFGMTLFALGAVSPRLSMVDRLQRPSPPGHSDRTTFDLRLRVFEVACGPVGEL